jgi:Zn-dependent peptidase ImmA (M78 family)/transcriptional regulator with XRE-family HTH domain
MEPITRLISERIRFAREEAGLSQEVLASRLGFNDRQTLSSIEVGQRHVTADELVLLSEVLAKPLDYFTDPYQVPEKAAFSYRAQTKLQPDFAEFERQAEKLISANRRFRELLSETPSPVRSQLTSLTKQVPLDFATFIGERTAAAWNLGDVPAAQLREAAERELGVSILYVDAPVGISGAACRLNDGDVILINRNEPLPRQNFDLGHEIFHLLTWEKMPPEHIDFAEGRSKVEKLADSFTAGLLMPSEVVKKHWSARGNEPLKSWVQRLAGELLVSVEALYWRLVNLWLVAKGALDPKSLGGNGQSQPEKRPDLYSKGFVGRLHKVLAQGRLSVRKAAGLLECTIEELGGLFTTYALPMPFEL